LNDPFTEGQRAFDLSMDKNTNPYQEGSNNHSEWENGFNFSKRLEALKECRNAYQNGVRLDDPFFDNNDDRYEFWKEGWYDAAWDD